MTAKERKNENGWFSEFRKTLSRSIYQGDRLKANLRAITAASVFCAILGIALLVLNLTQEGPANPFRLIMSIVTFLAGTGCAWLAHVAKRRDLAIIIPTAFCIAVFTYYALSGYAEGTGILWSVMLPIGMCYFISIRSGIVLSVYYSILYAVVFYTPLGNNIGQYYTGAFMARFPIMYFSLSIFTIISMYQYHKTALFEIDYTERLNQEVARQTAVAEERSRRIEQMSFQTMQTLANAIDSKDPFTKGHSARVSLYAVLLAERLGWEQERVNDLRYAALLHDIGKIGVPDSILNNPNKLTAMEYDIIKSHTTTGAEILRNRIMVSKAENVARSHHERYDGSGYPQGLKGKEISEEARIVAIADAFDAMSSNRVYRKAYDRAYILRELTEGRGSQFDPDFTNVFVSLWNEGKLEEVLRNEAESGEEEGMEASSALLQEVMEAFTAQNTEQTDLTTGIMNRAAGEPAIAKAMKESSGCFVFFDMDNLKKINDTYGHEWGDRALKMIGDILTENSGDGLCCRLGGDEFLMFIRVDGREEAEKRVLKVIRDFAQRKETSPETAPASLSAGIVLCSPTDSYSKVYSGADKALYLVKQNGKNGLSFYTEESGDRENEPADIHRLLNGIRNSGSYSGAMDVEYRQFAKLYEFFNKMGQRYGQPFRLVMVTLRAGEGESPRLEELEKAMYFMEQAIRQTIRSVDVLTRYNRQQYLVLMLGTDDGGVKIAADRIFRDYYTMGGGGAYTPTYDIAEPAGQSA